MNVFSRRRLLKTLGATATTGGMLVGASGSATAADIEVLFDYDRLAGENPQSITIDQQGTKYVSFPRLGEIRAISPDNQSQSVFTTFDIGEGALETGPVGLTVGPQGNVFACFWAGEDTDAHGIWRITPDGTKSLYEPFPRDSMPNDLIHTGNSLLVVDWEDKIWRVRTDEKEVWAAGGPITGLPNGITADEDGTVYVSSYDNHIVKIPVNQDGSAGSPWVVITAPGTGEAGLYGADGLAFDSRNNLYVAVSGVDTIARVTPEGTIGTLARDSDGLDEPSSVAVGPARNDRISLYITNFALNGTDPSLMKLDVDMSGTEPTVPRRPVYSTLWSRFG